MSGGSSKSGSAQKWARPIAQNAANTATGVYNANAGNTQAMANTVTGMIPNLVAKYGAKDPAMTAAQGYTGDVLAGKYLNGNPHLQGIIDSTNSDVTNGVNSQFSLAGRYGSGGHTGVLAKELAEAENSLRYGDYSAQQGRMDQAAALAPQLLSAQSGADTANIQAILQAAGIGAELPFTGLDTYSSALANLFNGGKQKQGTLGPIMAGIGGGLSAAASGGAFG